MYDYGCLSHLQDVVLQRARRCDMPGETVTLALAGDALSSDTNLRNWIEGFAKGQTDQASQC